MTNLAMDDRYFPLATAKGGAYLDPSKNVRQFNQTTHQKAVEYPPVDLGLKSEAKISWTSDGRDFPTEVQQLVNKIRGFENLQPNWDSYGAMPHEMVALDCAGPVREGNWKWMSDRMVFAIFCLWMTRRRLKMRPRNLSM
jgi:hypothetical protein